MKRKEKEKKKRRRAHENSDRWRRDEQEARLERRNRFDALDAREIHVEHRHPTSPLDALHFRAAITPDTQAEALCDRKKVARKSDIRSCALELTN